MGNPTVPQAKQEGHKTSLAEQGTLLGTRAEEENIVASFGLTGSKEVFLLLL